MGRLRRWLRSRRARWAVALAPLVTLVGFELACERSFTRWAYPPAGGSVEEIQRDHAELLRLLRQQGRRLGTVDEDEIRRDLSAAWIERWIAPDELEYVDLETPGTPRGDMDLRLKGFLSPPRDRGVDRALLLPHGNGVWLAHDRGGRITTYEERFPAFSGEEVRLLLVLDTRMRGEGRRFGRSWERASSPRLRRDTAFLDVHVRVDGKPAPHLRVGVWASRGDFTAAFTNAAGETSVEAPVGKERVLHVTDRRGLPWGWTRPFAVPQGASRREVDLEVGRLELRSPVPFDGRVHHGVELERPGDRHAPQWRWTSGLERLEDPHAAELVLASGEWRFRFRPGEDGPTWVGTATVVAGERTRCLLETE